MRFLEELLKQKKPNPHKKSDSFIKDEEDKLKKLLGLSVEIKLSKKDTGKIIISFSSQEEYDRIINSLK